MSFSRITPQRRQASGSRTVPFFDPATGCEIGRVAVAARQDLEAALAAVRRSQPSWGATPARERARMLVAAAGNLRRDAEAVAHLLTGEQGKPLAEARGEVDGAADMLEWVAGEAVRTYGRIIPSRAPLQVQQSVLRRPVGPVAVFAPWNFPLNQLVRKIAAGLAAGCCVIAKGAEETPASAAALVAAFCEAGLPPGVLNLVFGMPEEISEHLISSPAIRKISFTGSTVVGKKLAGLAGLHMKRMTMELGGHAPCLVFDDVDPAWAAAQIAAVKFRNAGQVCTSPTRIIVQSGIKDRFLKAFVEEAHAIRVGPGSDPQSRMGPLANMRRLTSVQALVDDAVSNGASLAHGGHQLFEVGSFFAPTILADVPVSSRIMNEEPFGPVASVNSFDSEEEAIAEANRLDFGLAAYAFTKQADRQSRLTDRVEAGLLSINHFGLGLPETPFGGIKDSGFGSEGGYNILDAYLQDAFVTVSSQAQ